MKVPAYRVVAFLSLMLLTLLTVCGVLTGCASKQEVMSVRCINGNMIEIHGAGSNTGRQQAREWSFNEQCELNQSSGEEDK